MSDTRNTKVLDLISAIEAFGVLVDAHDPYLLSGDINVHKSVNLIQEMLPSNYDGILIAVGHHEFRLMGIEAVAQLGKEGAPIFDLKGIFPHDQTAYQL